MSDNKKFVDSEPLSFEVTPVEDVEANTDSVTKSEEGNEQESKSKEGDDKRKMIDLAVLVRKLWSKKKVFFIMWPIVFIISCIIIFPEPRYYTSEVCLAPESSEASIAGGGLSSIASSFGINIGGLDNHDAIYPMLYPDLFDSQEFIVSLLDIQVKTVDGELKTDYYTYLRKHQKYNKLTKPLDDLTKKIKSAFSDKKPNTDGKKEKLNYFQMSEEDYNLCQGVMDKIQCQHDKKTDVIKIIVKDQDPLICATLADSVMHRLQNFIIMYRTSKARLDVDYYQHLVDSTKAEYDMTAQQYAQYCDSHKDVILQAYLQKRDELENDLQFKLNAYTAMQTQLQAMKAKVQERTPAFTTLKAATVPVKPAGPKRMIFVAAMLFLSTIATSLWLVRDEFMK